ncbi:MAG: polysaccharide deacetylase family protein [Saccharofermentanales bacterium]
MASIRNSNKIKNSRRTARIRRRNTIAALVLVATVATIVAAGTLMDRLGLFGDQNSSSAVPGSLVLSTDAASDRSASAGPTDAPSSTATPAPTTISSPTPTTYPTTAGGLSTKKLGWSFHASGKEGVPPTIQNSQQAMCDRYNARWQGDTTAQKVYITFTMGYEYHDNATRILDIAKEKNVKFTFFVVGNLFVNTNLRTMFLRMYNEGHLIGSHSWNHPMYDEMLIESGKAGVAADLKKVEDAYLALTGAKMHKIMRFPSGEYSEAALSVMQELGYTTYFWSFAYRDWLVADQPDPEKSLANMIGGLHNGAIFYLHTVSDTNVQILPEFIDEARERGYEIELLDVPGQ